MIFSRLGFFKFVYANFVLVRFSLSKEIGQAEIITGHIKFESLLHKENTSQNRKEYHGSHFG
ncbi:MAG: hypothetical protein CL524_09415 [Aequorivita sp.]|nr:hypothetical protein [Aequorivita sp.]MBF29744.1 hypothetical protein [Aequorivita sp.]